MSLEVKALKYGEIPRQTIELAVEIGSPAATVRYRDEKDIEDGDRILMQTPEGEEIGLARVIEARHVQARDALGVIMRNGAVYSAGSLPRLMASLNHHYDEVIFPTDRVKVIIFAPEVKDD